MNSRIFPARWAREVNSPRRSSRRWMMEKKISAMVSQEACTGGAGDVETGAGGQPCPGGPGGVGRPVVHDQVDVQVAGDGLADEGQERAEGGRVVAGDDLAGDLAGDHVHRGDQGYGAVPDVLELAPLTVPGPRPPGRVLAGPDLDAGLLVDAEQHRAGRRVAVQVADRPGLAEERRVVFAAEPAADQVRLDVRLSQDPAGLAGGDRDLMLSSQVRRDACVGPRRLRAGGFTGGGRDDQEPGVDVIEQCPAGPDPKRVASGKEVG